ncbi:DUF6221 family protein [Streptomyces zhihengii]|uniref:DUF6221 family protein n=1 Tax=Streptomyces zhihengii TaxID=1818004 RepID=UPI00362989C1
MNGDLPAFLRARLDEDETAACAAGAEGNDWYTAAPGTAVHSEKSPHLLLLADPEARLDSDSADRLAAHAARHDPARVLREVETARQILRWYEQPEEHEALSRFTTNMQRDVLEQVLRHLASSHAGHPDYRESWRP